MGMLLALEGWTAALLGLGGALGYLVFWGSAGVQGTAWMGTALAAALLLGGKPIAKNTKLLMSAIGSFLVSAWGVVFQLWLGDVTPVPVYLLRVALGGGCVWIFRLFLAREDPVADWLAGGLVVLALGQVKLLKWLGLGYIAAGFLTAAGTFPGAALAGLGLDLAQITKVPMTAVLCLCHLLRLIPGCSWKLQLLGIGGVYLVVMRLVGSADLLPLPGLMLGSALGEWLSPRPERLLSPGHTGRLQVKLEQMARTLTQTQQLLLETPIHPVDEAAMVEKVRLRACALCSLRGSCREQTRLTADHLHRPGEFSCRRTARIQGELGRAREHLAILNRDRKRRKEYHFALLQQYQFLSAYLQSQADSLGCREGGPVVRYRGVVSARSRGKELSNGDSCLAFPGKEGILFVILCDGMGTGLGAARESQSAASMLRQMLTADFPAPYALRSLNSLLLLRGLPGGVSVDLAQICLCTGSVVLYKWGAAPSYWVHRQRVERLGCANLPPGLGMAGDGETVLHLSLSRGDTLVLLSDGAAEAVTEDALRQEMPPGDLAQRLVQSVRSRQDDATAVVIRLLAREG
jgi:hypothetical protein